MRRIRRFKKRYNGLRTKYTPAQKEAFAQKMRENPSLPEQILYNILVEYGFTFTFQPVMNGYIPDFYFPDYSKIVEVDGRQHEYQKGYDFIRDQSFREKGIETLRIPAKLIFQDSFLALQAVSKFLTGKTKRKKA